MAGRKKETARQKMIGILYLVLLGLVALNVSDSILDAFKNLSVSLNTSTQNTQEGIDNMFNAFKATKLKDDPQRAQPIYAKAENASEVAQQLSLYIDSLRQTLTEEGGGENTKTGDLKKRDNLSISNRIMIKEGKASILKMKIDETRKTLQELTKGEVNFSLDAQDPPRKAGIQKTWEQASFGDGIPLTAALTALDKVKADVKNAEAAVIKHIFGEMDMAVVNLDKFAAVAVAPSSYIIQGQPYEAKIFLTAYDSQSSPQITVGGNSLPVVEGQATYKVQNNQEGIYTWTGTINVLQTDGTTKEYQTAPQTYQVARPAAVVSAEATKVLYIGVDNPISVSAAGIPKERIAVSGDGVTLSGSGGNYIARVSSPGKATIRVTATIDGKSQNMGSTEFKVKRIPKPKAKVAGKSGGAVSVAQLRGQDRIFAGLDDFEFNTNFTIVKFSMMVQKPRVDPMGPYQSNAGDFSAPMKNALSTLSPGSFVYFYDIIVKGPDGLQQEVDALSFRVN
jgi:gliding motility-associated protein GldM